MRRKYEYVHPCTNCRFKHGCCVRQVNHFILFPELLTEVSPQVLFPELYFHP